MLWAKRHTNVWLYHENHTLSRTFCVNYTSFVKYMDHFHKILQLAEKIYTGTACGACDKYEVWECGSNHLSFREHLPSQEYCYTTLPPDHSVLPRGWRLHRRLVSMNSEFNIHTFDEKQKGRLSLIQNLVQVSWNRTVLHICRRTGFLGLSPI